MTQVEKTALRFTTHPRIPLTIRRFVARRCIPQDGRPFEIEISGRPFAGVLDNYIEWMVYSTRSYFEYVYLNLLRTLVKGGVALDVGANVGNHSHAFSAFFDQVYAFEPFEPVAVRLEEKAARLENVSVNRFALGAQPATLRFTAPTTRNLGTGHIDPEGEISVEVVKGDDFVKESISEPVNFIKIDVEGHELEVLEGLSETITAHRPLVIFEAPKYLRKMPGRSLSEIFNYFPPDYQFVALKGQSTFPLQDDLPKVNPILRDNPRFAGKISYFIAYGPERALTVKDRRLVKASGS